MDGELAMSIEHPGTFEMTSLCVVHTACGGPKPLSLLTTKAVSLSASSTPLAATSTPQHSMASTPCTWLTG